MSRVGKYPVELKDGVTVALQGDILTVKGKLGELKLKIASTIDLSIDGNKVQASPKNEAGKVQWGTTRAHIQNMVIGVSKGFVKEMEILGVGYKSALKGKNLNLSLGYSHDIEYKVPEGVKIEIVSPTEFKVVGISKELVGQVASEIKKLRKTEPYKRKGVRYKGEYIRRKEGKKK